MTAFVNRSNRLETGVGETDTTMLPTLSILILGQTPFAGWPDSAPAEAHPKEVHLRNIRQLTFGGENAEAYWSADGKLITFQSTQPGYPDEQIFVMNADGSGKRLVSTGLGRTTCSYLTPDNKWVYFSSTHEKNPGAQERPSMREGYVWKVNPEFALWKVPLAGGEPTKVLDRGAYIAETTISPDGKYMTFTGAFDGDLEIYRANLDGSNVRRLTNEEGYDGGPFVSWDGKKIVYRRDRIEDDAERQDYLKLLANHSVRPSKLELFIMDSDGRNKKQVTDLDCASFAPFLHPNNKDIIFCSNFGDKKGREFDLWMIGVDGRNLRRITYTHDFDGFPMFSRDGKKLIFASNRASKGGSSTNLFVADFVP